MTLTLLLPEFENSVDYIASILPKAEVYGICRIVPPSWQPPCLIEEKNIWEDSTFATHVKWIDGLQNQYLHSKIARFEGNVKGKKRRSLRIGSKYGYSDEDTTI